MICPNCESVNTYVKDSRQQGKWRKRRYHCADCGHKFNTFEVLDERDIFARSGEKNEQQAERKTWGA